jgi:hypothetical protein
MLKSIACHEIYENNYQMAAKFKEQLDTIQGKLAPSLK